jgi:DDE superfamily endonuclease
MATLGKPIITYEPKNLLCIGLELVGFDRKQVKRNKVATNLLNFKQFYGSTPLVYTKIWEDLQTTTIAEARIPSDMCDVVCFLMSICFLRLYQTEPVRSATFRLSVRQSRKWGWYYVKKIQALKRAKIVWPEQWTNDHQPSDAIFICTIDGVHCDVEEPMHPTMSKNPVWYSHKSGKAAVNYQLAISIHENKLVAIDGPFPASRNDQGVFNESLRDKISPMKRVIVDKGYKNADPKLCKPSSHDSKEMREFKSRARARHESFNGRIKIFHCLSQRFRHGVGKHQHCFEAVCVICQYQLECGSPLFDVFLN